jgi:hypothetical protein
MAPIPRRGGLVARNQLAIDLAHDIQHELLNAGYVSGGGRPDDEAGRR